MKKFIVLVALASCSSTISKHPAPETSEPIPQTHGTISTTSTLEWLNQLARVSTCVKNSQGFFDELSKTEMLDMNGKTAKEVAEEIRLHSATISTYSYFNPFSKVLAYADMGKNEVKLRSQMNPRSMNKMVNTVIHETTHLIGYRHDRNGNRAEGDNLKTVPYVAGKIAEKHLEGCE